MIPSIVRTWLRCRWLSWHWPCCWLRSPSGETTDLRIRTFSPKTKPGPFSKAGWIILSIAATLLMVAVIRNLTRHDDITRWRTRLESDAGHPAWPAWSPQWPPLPVPAPRDRRLPRDLRGPYAFAATHREALQQIPCYCGCVRDGHESVLQCYLAGSRSDGTPLWTAHSFDCELCVHIAREVMLMTSLRMPVSEIRKIIETKYEKVGTPTHTATVGFDVGR